MLQFCFNVLAKHLNAFSVMKYMFLISFLLGGERHLFHGIAGIIHKLQKYRDEQITIYIVILRATSIQLRYVIMV